MERMNKCYTWTEIGHGMSEYYNKEVMKMNDITRLKDTFDQMNVKYRQFSTERDSTHYIIIHIDREGEITPVRFIFNHVGKLVVIEGD